MVRGRLVEFLSTDQVTGYRVVNGCRLYARDLFFLGKSVFGAFRSNDDPIVLCNSFPKSGTHLLFQILATIPAYKPWDDIVSVQALSGVMNTASHIAWKLGSAPNNAVVRAHLMHCDEISRVLSRRNYKQLFIYRDPRDVALSFSKWAYKESKFFLHPIYKFHLRTDDERLMATIKGTFTGSPFGSNVSYPPICYDFLRWKPWINDTNTLPIRFEDLVGSRGGGDDNRRFETVRSILEYLDVDMTDKEIESKFSTIALDPRESHTFRAGKIGEWRKAFNTEHKEAFKANGGSILIDLGYEDTNQW